MKRLADAKAPVSLEKSRRLLRLLAEGRFARYFTVFVALRQNHQRFSLDTDVKVYFCDDPGRVRLSPGLRYKHSAQPNDEQ